MHLNDPNLESSYFHKSFCFFCDSYLAWKHSSHFFVSFYFLSLLQYWITNVLTGTMSVLLSCKSSLLSFLLFQSIIWLELFFIQFFSQIKSSNWIIRLWCLIFQVFFYFILNDDFISFSTSAGINPLSSNSTKRSNSLKQFASNIWWTVWMYLTILWGMVPKGSNS